MTRRRSLLFAVIAVVALAGLAAWWVWRPRPPADLLTLSGNVDLRQVELAFNDSDRIQAVFAQEGDRVVQGQRLAVLDTRRLAPEAAQVEALEAAQRAAVERLHAGSRPQEIAEAKDALAAATADAVNARGLYERASGLWSASSGQAAVSRQDVDNAKAALDAAEARRAAQSQAYDLAVIGPRREDIAQAEAQLRANRAQLTVLRRQLADAELVSPVTGVVRARLMEPGEMASPQRAVFTIAETSPKWVRAYLDETDLARVHPGMAATVSADGTPARSYRGWVGFISSVAEFTPKTVQTTELRPSLVYEVRVFVVDPGDDLRLGMPATVSLHLGKAGPEAGR
jgi:HlyD family secretion protein